jgi:hypothetical protein
MSDKQWYLHLQGETVGPLVTGVVQSMLKQKRLELYEYIWCEGMTSWTRICDVAEFSTELSPYPKAPFPASGGSAEPARSPVRPDVPQAAPKAASQSWPHARRYVRVAIQGVVEIQGHGSFPLVNISENGIFVHSDLPMSIGIEIKFKITSPALSKPLEMSGVTIRAGVSDGKKGFAIEFTRVNPAHGRILAECIGKNSNSSS